MLIILRERNLYMDQVAVKAWGNSQGIRIPKAVLDRLHIKVSDILQLEVKDETIILKKAFRHKTLEERAEKYGGEISVCDFDWGEPVGREML